MRFENFAVAATAPACGLAQPQKVVGRRVLGLLYRTQVLQKPARSARD
jgi:hypothetical protein